MRSMRIVGVLAGGACALALFTSAAEAQPTRDMLSRELEQNMREMRIFLSSNRSLAERLVAGRAAEGVTGVDQETRAITLFRNASADARLRAIALDKLHSAVAADAGLQRDVASVLADRASAAVLREQALDVIEGLSFARPASSLAAGTAGEKLLELLDDPNPAFRLRGMALLMQEDNEAARTRLGEGLLNPTAAAVPPPDAVRLLGAKLVSDVLPLLRQMMTSPPDQATRIEAIRALGRDPESREAIAALLRDPRQPQAVRLQALASLDANLGTPEFIPHARPIVGDESAGDSLRVYAIQSVKYRRGTVAELAEDEFDAVVRAIAASSSASAVLRQVARGYVQARGL